ncbi:MAG: signal peptidase, partial [Marmoricola sp.]|nr:signal peptidase [Marmoricola sp.]
MTGRRILRMLREVSLTLGAIVGVLCIAMTLAGALFGVKPLLFRSGSMSPAIKTGDLAFSRTVDASALHPGDIVSVINSSGERVTHRLVSSAKQGDARQLKLKGDANKTPDAEIYTAVKVQRIMFDVPKLGYVVSAASSRFGVFVLGLYVALMLLLTFRRPRSDGPGRSPDDRPPPASRPGRRAQRKRRRPFAKSTAALFVVMATLAPPGLLAGPTWAAPWTDGVVVAGGTYTASVFPAPTTFTCG